MAALTKVVDISPGQTLQVTVDKVATVTPEQRDALLNQTRELLISLQKGPQTPETKARIQQLGEQQQLLQSARLQWVTLQLPDRSLLTYTDKTLTVGQILGVNLSQPGQRLSITENLSAPSVTQPVASQPALATEPAQDNRLRALLSLASSLLFPDTGSDKPLSPVGTASTQNAVNAASLTDLLARVKDAPLMSVDKAAAHNAIVETLRQLLPVRDLPTEIYQALPLLQQLPASLRQQLLPATVQQALKSFAEQLRSPLQLSNPQLIPMALKNSGNFFEQKLAGQAASLAAQSANTRTATTGPDNLTRNVLTSHLTHQDLKGALLHLLFQLRQESGISLRLGDVPNPAMPVATKSSQTVAAAEAYASRYAGESSVKLPEMPQGLVPFLHQLSQRTPQELSAKTLRNQLMMLMQQHTLLGLSKIQMRQTHTLSRQLATSDSLQPSQSFIFDIPIRYGQDIQYLNLHFQQQWMEDESNENSGNTEKTKQWSVMLRFDLPAVGGFYVQLQVADNNLSASLWAERESTRELARANMQKLKEQLEAEGISIKNFQCLNGVPSDNNPSLNYSLVDVKL